MIYLPDGPSDDPTLPNKAGVTDYAPYLTMAGGGLGAGASLFAGAARANLLRTNAAIAGLQQQSTLQAGGEHAEIFRQRLNQTLGRQGAQVGGSGVTTSGSALRALESTAQIGNEDIARIQLNAARKAWGFGVQQQSDIAQAGMSQRAGVLGGLGGLITSGARAYGQWSTD